MPGPPPTPAKLIMLRGNPGHRSNRRLSAEPQPEVAPNCPEAPDFLAPYAVDEWWRVAPELHRLGLLTIIDIAPLAAYCQAYAHWRTAEEALAKMRGNDPQFSGLMVKRDRQAVVNPLVSIARKAAADMVRFASEFGLSPVARSRIAAGISAQPPRSKFDGLIR